MLRFSRPGLAVLVALVSACASAEENLIGSDTPLVAGAGGVAGAAGSGGLAGSGGSGQAGAGQGGSLSAGAAGQGGAAGTAQGGAAGSGGDAGAGCGAEVCGNLSDDNCDGKIDDGCVCTPGATSACFGAPEAFRGKGVCRDGITQCTGPAEFGYWTECVGDVLPGVEVCDPEQIDEDCDGAANEGCECEEGSAPVPCGSDVGLCQKGLQACEGGKLGACVGSVDPSPELCDGLDNDCDGEADEALSRPCGESKGACSPGFQACQQGTWGACEGDTPPSEEICDGIDNDCDGQIDDGVLTTCGVSTGACKIGSQACVDGALATCSGAIGPAEEICNNVDDDCDGLVDEGLTEACGSSIGACKPGVRACAKGAWGACVGEVGPVDEACDGVDNDCDGTTDEGCSCLVGSPPVACGSTVGACKAGEQSCIAGQLGPCVGAVPPSSEICNNVDDDCDGQIDEGVTEACGSSIGTCQPGVKTCAAGAWGACVGEVGPVDEVCDGLDNDCDGLVDEGLTRSCGSDVGRCVSGLETCAAGAWGACVGAVGPLPEVCDGAIDEDCDGAIDDGCVCAVGSKQPCGVSVGACQQGEQTCDAAGQWGPCVGAVAPAAELCDGVDNDCDGQLDEGCACISGEARLCGSNQGQCSFGVEICSAAGQWGPCAGGVGPGAELCDGLDNDCDGQTDEGCGCINGQTQPCGADVGQCKLGKQTCTLAGQWGPCAGGVGPANEVCNGLDDDCDGKADEEGVCPVFPPAASCPGDAATTVGTTVTLGGAGSDPDGGAVTFSWSVSGRPQGSTAQPVPVNAASTKFTPDLAGAYELTFCVTDDEGLTTCCKTKVNATSNCSQPPTAPVVKGCGTSWDRRPIIEFSPLPAGQVYEVLQDGVAAPLATLTLPGQNYYRPPSPLGAGGPPPGVAVGLSVRACKADNKTCCATSNTVQPLLVEACSTLTSPTTQNVLFSEYLINGSGGACPSASCQAGEAIEITNLSHCPVSLEGHHFGYQNPNGGTFRWMNFTPADVIPPRGVYVAIRNRAASACPLPFFGPDDPALFGLKISALDMQGDGLDSGWFNNGGGGQGTLRIATGSWQSITSGATIAKVSPYAGSNQACTSVGFNAIDACGDVVGVPTAQLSPNQLGRLWRPCDRVVNPVPAGCQLTYPELPYAPSFHPLASGPRSAVSLRAGGPLDHHRHQRISHHRAHRRQRRVCRDLQPDQRSHRRERVQDQRQQR